MLTHRAREKYCTKCSAHHAIVRDYGLECVGKKRYWLSRSVIGRFDLNSISRRLIFHWTLNVRFLLLLMIVELAWFWISDGAKECRGWPWNWIGFERFQIPVFWLMTSAPDEKLFLGLLTSVNKLLDLQEPCRVVCELKIIVRTLKTPILIAVEIHQTACNKSSFMTCCCAF